MPISALPPVPLRTDDPDTFIYKADVFMPALQVFADQANFLAANLNSVAAGGAFALPYIIDLSATTVGDPGVGKLRFNNAVQASSTTLCLDDVTGLGNDVSSLVTSISNSTSAVKGKIRIQKASDPTKWLMFDVTNVSHFSATGGYTQITVTNSFGIGTSPFSASDAVVLFFQYTGDKGDQGIQGTVTRRPYSVGTIATLTPNVAANDMCSVTSLTGPITIANPTGTPTDGFGLIIRLKDSGAARLITWGGAYRASTDLLLPTSTVAGKTVYMGFVYNNADAKWDLLAVLNNF